jgi:hypothetical protein
MQSDNSFHWAGAQIGRLLRIIVDGLSGFFGHIFVAIDAFYTGLSGELGISGSLFSLLILVIGVLLLVSGLRALTRRHLVSALIQAFFGVLLLSWMIH